MAMQTSRHEAGLNDDMLVEILTRLPLKSFSRSKCVSKSWQALTADDQTRNKLPLIVSGIFQHSSDSNLFTQKSGPSFISTSSDNTCFHTAALGSFPFKSNSTLIDCCNGLLLFYSSSPSWSFYVYNPITTKYTALPKPFKETKLSVLAFDPYISRHFKVVSFTGWHTQSADVEVFDSESGNWGQHQLHWGLDTNSLSATMRYLNGVLYIVGQSEQQLVAIDLARMTCYLIALPEGSKRECCIGKLGGRLHYVVNGGGNKLMVWVLKDEGEGEWEMKHCVNFGCKMDHFKVLALNPERDVVYLSVKGELIAYDVGKERVDEVWEVAGKEVKGYLVQVSVFPFSKYMEDCLSS